MGFVRASSLSRKTVSFLILGAWLALLGVLNAHLIGKKIRIQIPADEPPFVWHPELYRILTFGNVPAAVDALLLKFLVEDNIQHVEPGVRARVYYFLDLATELDPAFFSLYTAGTNFLAVARNDKSSALKLITKGETFRKTRLSDYPEKLRREYWADEWRVPFIKGYVHLFEMNDLPAAAEAYGELDSLPGVPEPIRDLGKRFDKPGGIYEVGINVLGGMIPAEENETVRKELERKRDSLILSHLLARLNEEFRKFPKHSRETPAEKWLRFREANRFPDRDRWGGTIFLRDDGTIDSTTPRMSVLGVR